MEKIHLKVISVINDLPDNIVFSLITEPTVVRTEKPINCNHCDKCFPNKHYLIIHQRTHSEERPFKCDQCVKCFTQRSGLLRHQRTHSGEKLFKCDQCDKCFAHKNTFYGTSFNTQWRKAY